MHRIARTGAVLAATAGLFTVSTGAALAHYCYRTDVPESSKMSMGGAWMTQQEAFEAFSGFLGEECATDAILSKPEGTLFMGPGLLAAGAVRKGNAPDGIGHLIEDAQHIASCSFLFEEE